MRVSDPAIVAHDLVLAYGTEVALDQSSLAIPRGKVTAVIGPNGSGKSTLLGALAGLITPLRGKIAYGQGIDRSKISYVLQNTKVNETLPVSVREVVTMGRYSGAGVYRPLSRDDRAAVANAMERTGIVELGSRHLRHLSAGQRQRVFVAQGLAQDHDLLLLDEPLTGIDLAAAQAIDQVIHDEINRGCTVVVTTHDLSQARIADHTILLAGRVVASGTSEEVLTADNLATAYGQTLLHLDEGPIFVDDAAHRPVPGRHLHRERTVSPESEH